MSEIIALRPKDISAEMVLQNCLDEKPDHVYIVSYKDGEACVWASGDMKLMPAAALILNNRATQYAMGEVDDDE